MAWLPFEHVASRALALDLACGRGRHCRLLVERGYRVIAADISRTALLEVSRIHADLRAAIACVQADFDLWPFADESFDLVVQCDFLDRRLFPALRRAVKPGGLLLIDTFLGVGGGGEEGPGSRDYRLEQDELATTFSDWQIVRRWVSDPAVRETMLTRRP